MLSILKKNLIRFTVFISCAFSLPALAGSVYAQLYNNTDQLPTMSNINQGIPIEMQVDKISGVSWDAANKQLLIQEEGLYFIMAVLQAGAQASATNIVKGGDVFFWYELNGTAIADSGSWVFVSPSSTFKTIVDQLAIPLKKGDALSLMYSSTAPSIGLLAAPADKNRPAAGSVSLSVVKLDLATSSYAQLSSNQEQGANHTNHDTVIQLQHVNAIKDMEWNTAENKLTVSEDGLYFIMLDAQVGLREHRTLNRDTDINIWVTQNNAPINSNSSWIKVTPQSKANAITNQYILPLRKNDFLQFMFASSEPKVGLVNFRGTELRPNSPGVTGTVFKIPS